MISIIIPAHNEEASIGECLSSLTTGAEVGEFEVIVVCNGCTDRTIERAREALATVQIVELTRASKTEALNAGDAAATRFPRIYLDADIRISAAAIRATMSALSEPGKHIASACPEMDFSRSSILVKAFYDVWLNLPHIRRGMVGTGFYAVSEQGRSRFDQFPDVIADDTFVRSLFKGEEMTFVTSESVLVRAPGSVRGLVRIMSRARLGTVELARSGRLRLDGTASRKSWASLLTLAASPWMMLRAPVYLSLTLIARARAWAQLRNRQSYTWERARDHAP